MLKALREFHELGFVHRNISPYSFVFKSFHEFEVLLTDFGLAKRWRSPEGEIYPPRKNVGLRGMSRYASISSHEGKDWGRVDDLWSFFYVLTELPVPVPWKKIDDRDTMHRLKMEYQIGKKLCEGFPKQFQMISDYLESLSFADEPNYDWIIDMLGEMADDHECNDTPFYKEISFVDICPLDFKEPDFNIEGNWSEDSQSIHDESQKAPRSVQEESKNASQLAQEESQDSHPESCCLIF